MRTSLASKLLLLALPMLVLTLGGCTFGAASPTEDEPSNEVEAVENTEKPEDADNETENEVEDETKLEDDADDDSAGSQETSTNNEADPDDPVDVGNSEAPYLNEPFPIQ